MESGRQGFFFVNEQNVARVSDRKLARFVHVSNTNSSGVTHTIYDNQPGVDLACACSMHGYGVPLHWAKSKCIHGVMNVAIWAFNPEKTQHVFGGCNARGESTSKSHLLQPAEPLPLQTDSPKRPDVTYHSLKP